MEMVVVRMDLATVTNESLMSSYEMFFGRCLSESQFIGDQDSNHLLFLGS